MVGQQIAACGSLPVIGALGGKDPAAIPAHDLWPVGRRDPLQRTETNVAARQVLAKRRPLHDAHRKRPCDKRKLPWGHKMRDQMRLTKYFLLQPQHVGFDLTLAEESRWLLTGISVGAFDTIRPNCGGLNELALFLQTDVFPI